MRKFVSVLFASLAFALAGNASATAITFSSVPTNTTYLSSGLLLSSSNGYAIGGCGGISSGCLGPNGFSGTLTFRFVIPNTTTQSFTTSVSLVSCEGCTNRASSVQFFDSANNLLSTMSMNVGSMSVAAHTFAYSAANIGSVKVQLSTDAVESMSFAAVGSAVPEPGSIALLGLGLAGLLAARRKTAKK